MAAEHHQNADVKRPAESDPERVKLRQHVAESLPEAEFGEVLVLSQEGADRVCTPARRDLVDALAAEPVESQRELAERLDRDPGNVKRDLAVSIEEGVVARERDGRSYRPYLLYDTVIPEPIPTAGRDPEATGRY